MTKPFGLKTPILTGAVAVYPYSDSLDSVLTFQSNFDETVKMGVRVGNTLWVPREFAPVAESADYRVSFPVGPIQPKKPPRDAEQATLIKDSAMLLMNGTNHVFEAPTGFGKSYCGAAIACMVGQTTLIVVTKDDLMQQWKDTLINLMGIPANEIGHIQQSVCKIGKRFTVAMVHSLIIEDKYPPEMFKQFGMVLFDEVHRMAADSFVKACQMFPGKYRLGLSATPKRSDGKELLIHGHIGQTLVRGNSVPMAPKILVVKTGWKIPKQKRYKNGIFVMEPLPHSAGKMMLVTKAQAADHNRNRKIVEFVVEAHKSDRRVVVMSDLVDGHLVPLFHLLAKAGIPAEKIGYYVGQKSKLELEIAKTKPVVLATYGMCSEGTDVPAWDCLVFATPRANIKQSLGRILRKMEGKKTPICLDLVDDDPVLSGFFYKRLKQYFEVGAEVVNL